MCTVETVDPVQSRSWSTQELSTVFFEVLPAGPSFERFRSVPLFLSTVGRLFFQIGRFPFFRARSDDPTKRRLAAKGLGPERPLGEVFVLENFLSFFLSFFLLVGVRGRHISGGGRM